MPAFRHHTYFRATPISFIILKQFPIIYSYLTNNLIWFDCSLLALDHTKDLGMGNVHHKIPKDEMDFLLKNTKFDKNTIKQWYDAFLVS